MNMKANHKYTIKTPKYLMSFDIETWLRQQPKPKQEFIIGTICLKDLKKNAYYRYEFHDKNIMSRFIATSKFSGYNSFNTGFNVAFDLYMLPLVYHKNFEDYQKGRIYIAKYHKRNKVIRFVDIANFYFGSLNDVGQLFNLQKMDKPPYLGKRKPKNKQEMNYLLDYCYHDSFITNKISEFWLNQFMKFETGICVTPSQFSFKIFRTHFQKHDLFMNPKEYQLKHFRKTYHGGRTEALKLGTIEGQIRSYDYNSAYVYAMQEHYLPIEPYKKVINPRLSDLNKLFDNSINCYAKVLIDVTNPTLGFTPVYHKNLKFPVGKYETYVLTPDLKLLNEYGYIKKIRSLQIANGDYILRDFAKWVWKKRTSAESQIMNLVYKGIGNYLYGKFAQINEFYHRTPLLDYLKIENINDFDINFKNKRIHVKFYYNKAFVKQLKPSNFLNFPIASEITSYVRNYLLEDMIKNLDSLLYVDTDSLFTQDKKLSLSSKLGGLKLENDGDKIKILKEKIYIIYKKNKIVKQTTKGFPQYIRVNNKKKRITLKFNKEKDGFGVDFKILLSPKMAYIQRKNPYVSSTIHKNFKLLLNTKRELLSKDFEQEIETKPFNIKFINALANA